MKKTATFILFLVICTISALSEDSPIKYQNQNFEFSVTFPNYWIEIPKMELMLSSSKTAKKYNQQTQYYLAGYQYKFNAFFEYPYALIDASSSTASLEEIKDQFEKYKDSLEGAVNKLSAKSTSSNVSIDKLKNCCIFTFDVNHPERGKVKGIIVSFPGKISTALLMFYSTQYEKDKSDFEFIINNFRFSPGYGYQDREEKKKSAIAGIPLTTILAALILLLLTTIKKRKTKSLEIKDKS